MIIRTPQRPKTDEEPTADVTPTFGEVERYVYSPRGASLPLSPIVVAPAFRGRPLTVLEFLFAEESQQFLELIFGARGTEGFVMLRDFRRATRGLYFGYRRAKSKARPPKNPGRLDENNSETRGRLTEFARHAYRGDPDRYSQIYWKRIAGLIWDSYRFFNSTRERADWIKQREDKRIAEIPKRRAKTAARVQAHRKRKTRKQPKRSRAKQHVSTVLAQ